MEIPALGVFCGRPVAGAVVLIAQAGYHLDDLVPTAELLRARDIPVAIACVLPRPSALRHWRSSWWRHQELIARAKRESLGQPTVTAAVDVVIGSAAVVVRNDWGPVRAVVERARSAGIPTIGWIEGAQDFGDADTGRERRAYRTVDHVLSLGSYDAGQLSDADVTPVGSEALWNAWHGNASTSSGPSVANVNFTYGVLEPARTTWVREVLCAAALAEVPVVLSRHPADRGRVGRRAESHEPISTLLSAAPRLVSRFSTLCYEALARGVELVYHNPHGERVPTFSDPQGAFLVTSDLTQLTEALIEPPRVAHEVRSAALAFLTRHVVLDGERPAARAADRIAAIARG